MPGDSERSDVRIAVQRESASAKDDSYLRSGPLVHTPEYTVVVPITDAVHDSSMAIDARQFLRTATALAADNEGRVLLLGIETVTNEASLEAVRKYVRTDQPADPDTETVVEVVEERRAQLARVADVAQNLDSSVPTSAVVRVVTDTTEGILDVIGDGNETAVLLLRDAGIDGGEVLNRSTIDTVLADAECDVFVENLGVKRGENALYVPDVEEHTVASLAQSDAETIDSILLPVGTGPHSALATEAARAVARATDASITVLHVISPDGSDRATTEGEDLLTFAEYVLGSDVTVETELREASDTTEEIVQEAKAHDFTSIGMPENKSRLEQFVFGSVQQTLSELSEVTVLLSRDPDRVMRSLYYRWKRGIEAIDDDS